MGNNNKYQRSIYGILNDRPIAFSPRLASVLGSINASILLAQLLYWRDKGDYQPWVYKTIEEMKEETGLSRSEQETAIRKCKEKEILITKLKGIPARRFFYVDIERLIEEVDGWIKTNNVALQIPAEALVALQQTITDSTQDKTQKITPIRKKLKKRVRQDKNVAFEQSRNALVKRKSF